MKHDIKSFKYFEGLGIAYQSFGKTGNTAILNLFILALKNKGFDIKEEGSVHKILNSSSQQLVCHYGLEESNDIFGDIGNKFVVSIRNPFTRLLSLYLHITSGGTEVFPPKWKNKLKCKEGFYTFEEFLDALYSVGVDNIDGHTYSIAKRSLITKADYDYVIRFENFENDLKVMMTDCFDFDLEVDHKGVKTNSGSKIYKFYNARCVEIVKELYFDDFQVLGYPLNIDLAASIPEVPIKEKRIPELSKLNF